MVHRRWVLLFSFTVAFQEASGGPWTRTEGSAFLQVGFSSIGYNTVYDDASDKRDIGSDVRDNVLQILGDVGITDRLSVTAMVPYKFLSVKPVVGAGEEDSKNGPGDIEMGARYNFLKSDGSVVTGAVFAGLPVGSTGDTRGLYLGDGEFNAGFKIMAGRSFHPARVFLTAEAGVNFRTGGFSHEALFGIEAGYRLWEEGLLVLLTVSGQQSFNNSPSFTSPPDSSDLAAAGLGLYTNNREFLAIIPKLLYKFTGGTGLVLSYATAAGGRNVAGGAVLSAALFHEF